MADEVSRPLPARFGRVHMDTRYEYEGHTMYPPQQEMTDTKQEKVEQTPSEKSNEIAITYEAVFPPDDEKARFNDWPFALLFFVVLIVFIAAASLVLRASVRDYLQMGSIRYQGSSNLGPSNYVALLFLPSIIALCFAGLGFTLCQLFPAFFIYCGMIINLLTAFGIAVMFLVLKYWTAGAVFLVFTLIGVWCYWNMRSRVPFSVALLKTVVLAMRQMPQTLLVSLIGSLVGIVFSIIFSAAIVATYMEYGRKVCDINVDDCSRAKLIGLLVCVFFSGFYVGEVIRNVIHCTVSGVFGCWYYTSGSKNKGPKWPAMGSLKRAMTRSFGSICFGSLIVSIIETLRQSLRLIRESLQLDSDLDGCGSVGFFAIDLIISFLDFLVRHFNHYAYCFIALYGKPYLKAAKETWHMMKYKGFDILINDNLINIALGLYSLFAGYMSALFAFLYLRFTRPDHNILTDFNVSVMAISFFIALQICNITNETIRSGVSTFLVTLGNDPELFKAKYPRRFEEIFGAYPNVLNKLDQRDV
ncbi:hypothetical protein ZYGR_0N05070 [Zygosaccharomyces rouxii]|uniref:Protein PNS1 n=2 Tax=Zygosaccharomyces rouxii TaxID=4956 RepID=C5DW50_ZYGRC|nr:uncharacterized protein ZYRO0D11924g [Zygosaccharomyces rouxii]KAH9200929.1 plasma-membrane choline transporter-domain-containing protein [Zygosaccharomyces rouxii]GAV49102.1 hypothetical protein ZYGR_0N05070 [Zygosaccharomyces rouxii]CAR28019.1 ZYRO0D11924p [Zygosaccharomyces rouxii]